MLLRNLNTGSTIVPIVGGGSISIPAGATIESGTTLAAFPLPNMIVEIPYTVGAALIYRPSVSYYPTYPYTGQTVSGVSGVGVLEYWDGSSWVTIQLSAGVPPTGGTTLERDALTPTIGQTFFNTDINKMEEYDGTAWGIQLANLPPRKGSIGVIPTTHWRLIAHNLPSGYGFSIGELFSTLGVSPSMASITFNRALSVFSLYPGYSATPSVSNNIRSTAGSNNRYTISPKITFSGKVKSVTKMVIDLVYPKAISPDTLTIAYQANSSSYLNDFDIYMSQDLGTTWSLVDTFTKPPSTGITRLLNIPTYPLNPVSGQRFFNTTTFKEMEWDTNVSKWVPAPSLGVRAWKSIPATTVSTSYQGVAGDRLLSDTTVSADFVNLPTAPVLGDDITFLDSGKNWTVSPITVVAPTGVLIDKTTATFLGNISGKSFSLVFDGLGWALR